MNFTDEFTNTNNLLIKDTSVKKKFNITDGTANPSVIFLILQTEKIRQYN